MTITLRPRRLTRMRPFNRNVLLAIAAGLVALAALLPLMPDARSPALLVAAVSLYLLLLAVAMLVTAWRQRIEVDATHIVLVPGWGRRRAVPRADVAKARLRTANASDSAGYRYLDLCGSDATAPPLLSIVLDVYSRADQAWLIDLARECAGRSDG